MAQRGPEELGGSLLLPRFETDPFRAVTQRVLVAVALLLLMAVLVWLDADGYSDVDGTVSFLDALYYATVSASTTGYGDIAPVSPEARWVNVLVVTPLRVAFLAVMIGTTVEVLTRTGRARLRVARWQRGISGHTVVVGFGTKGQATVARLLKDGLPRERIVAVTDDADGIARATRRGIVGVVGDGSRDSVLLSAVVDKAACVIVAVPTDATAVLITLTARRLNPKARIVAAARKGENAGLLKASGADNVIVSADATGRQLALGLTRPVVGELYAQMLERGRGVELTERPVTGDEVGRTTDDLPDLVLAVARSGTLVDVRGGERAVLADGDRLVLLRGATPAG
jgi:voltage-gated potassium channel